MLVFYMDKLSHINVEEVNVENWRPIKGKRNGTQISHLMFTKNLLISTKASMNQI